MNIKFSENGLDDYTYWIETDSEIVERINTLIKEIKKSPFKGTGKTEALRHSLQGYWSRRITREHRLVYRVDGKKGEDQTCTIVQLRFHYDD